MADPPGVRQVSKLGLGILITTARLEAGSISIPISISGLGFLCCDCCCGSVVSSSDWEEEAC